MKNYYFVGETKTQKILGFNLTEIEKDKLFYNKLTPSGGKTSTGNFYGATEFKVVDADELKRVFELRKFKNNNEYSYVIVSTENEWLANGFNETEEQVIETIKEVEEINKDVSFYIYEITGQRLEIV